MSFHSINKIGHFYDKNTGLFLRFGHSVQGSIHRAVWADGVTDRHAALHYVDELVSHYLPERNYNAVPHVIDLGCGVAASLGYIAANRPVTALGVTISKGQWQLANARIKSDGLEDKIQCLHGDFCSLPENLELADLVFAIESFVHAENAEAFFSQASKLLKPGAHLIICDDFLSNEECLEGAESKTWIQRFRRGWLIESLLTPGQADEIARGLGLRLLDNRDLSPYLELGRPRDRIIAGLLRMLGEFALSTEYLRMLYGGNALQRCLGEKWLSYRFLVWEKTTG